MFGIDAQELLVIVVVAVLVIGPKDMPLAMRTAGRWIAKVRRVSNHFRAGIETMIREAEMEDMEKKWAEQNAKIMREHPADAPPEMEPTGALPSRPAPDPQGEDPAPDASAESRSAAARPADDDGDPQPSSGKQD
jgi:sec-independent protein translocase protein TatB